VTAAADPPVAQGLAPDVGWRPESLLPDRHRSFEFAADVVALRFAGPGRFSGPSRPHRTTGPQGAPLPAPTHDVMRSALGHDFSRVRVHADPASAARSRALGARAFAEGRNIYFGAREYAPDTRSGQALLAHELTHVLQQQQAGAAWPQYKGVTFTGFFANLFRTWDYSRERLDEYLGELRSTNDIVDDHDSDDMARQIAGEWAEDTSAYDLDIRLRVLLIEEMLSGWTLPADQEGILNLLEASSNSDLEQIIGDDPEQVSYARLYEDFGRHRDRLEYFNREILSRLGELQEPPADAQSLLGQLEASEEEYGVHVDEVTLAFHWAPGRLYRSCLVDVDVPERGSEVTIRITRERLVISISPGLEIDIFGPVNTSLTGVEFGFEGLEGELRLSRFSELANEKLHEYLQTLLRGTRFADPDYDFRQDPYLLAEIQDESIIGDIRRIQYNFQKDDPPEADTEAESDADTEAMLESISRVGGSISVTNRVARRFPEGDGWGAEIPEGTTFRLAMELDSRASELQSRDAHLERLQIESSGLYIVKDDVRLVRLSGLEITRGLEFDLRGFQALTDLTPYIREEARGVARDWLPESWQETAGGLIDLVSPLAANYAEELSEIGMGVAAPYLVSYFKPTLMDYSGMSAEQVDAFFEDRR
jgi:hypothetical protein